MFTCSLSCDVFKSRTEASCTIRPGPHSADMFGLSHLALRESFQLTLRGSKGVALRIADDLVGYPMITATLASKLYGVSYQAANSAIAKLVDLKILRQRTAGRYDRIFQCDAVLTALEY